MAAAQPLIERKPKQKRKKEEQKQEEEDEELSPSPQKQCSKIVTPLVAPPEPSQLPRWSIRSMWELASILNFLHVSSFLCSGAVKRCEFCHEIRVFNNASGFIVRFLGLF